MSALRALVITVSDRVSRGEADDRSGPAAAERLAAIGFVCENRTVPDGVDSVATVLKEAVQADYALVVTTGGTGFTSRDLTPEATALVIERPAPGLPEAMRAETFGVNPHGMLSRAVAGIAGQSLIVNLPGSVSGVTESLAAIAEALPHAVALIRSAPTDH
jgi:molybdenum cofactor synthesis domain-containing protein